MTVRGEDSALIVSPQTRMRGLGRDKRVTSVDIDETIRCSLGKELFKASNFR